MSLYNLYAEERTPEVLLRAEGCFRAADAVLNAQSFPDEAAGIAHYLDQVSEERSIRGF